MAWQLPSPATASAEIVGVGLELELRLLGREELSDLLWHDVPVVVHLRPERMIEREEAGERRRRRALVLVDPEAVMGGQRAVRAEWQIEVPQDRTPGLRDRPAERLRSADFNLRLRISREFVRTLIEHKNFVP